MNAEDDDLAEPPPLIPGRSVQFCVRVGHDPQEALLTAPVVPEQAVLFGPIESKLSRSVQCLCLPHDSDDDECPGVQERDDGCSTFQQQRLFPVATRPPTMDQDDEPNAGDEGCWQEPASALHSAVWLADTEVIDRLLSAKADINAANSHGATPLMLCIELLPRAPQEYMKVVTHLLDKGVDPRVRSSTGWSPLDEAASLGDKRLVRALLDGVMRTAPLRWGIRLGSLAKSLNLLPDFECSIRWEFESPVIPGLNKIAPSDVIHLRKCGTRLRVDSTLASWKKLRLSKRRNLTTLFRGENLESVGPGRPAGQPWPALCMLNHDKKMVVDVTEGLDANEAKAVVDDLMDADITQWDMEMSSLEVVEATNWFGSTTGPCDVNGWKATRFDVKGTVGLAVRKKGQKKNNLTFQQYFGRPLPAQACLPELRSSFQSFGFGQPELLSREGTKISAWSESTESLCDVVQQQHQQQQVLERRQLEQQGKQKPEVKGFAFDDEPMDIEVMPTTSEVLTAWPGLPSDSTAGAREAKLGIGEAFGAPAPAVQPPKQPAQELPTNDRKGKTSKPISASVWFANDFPIPLQQFLPILDTLAAEHETMRRLKQLLEAECLSNVARRICDAPGGDNDDSAPNIFPVRASVPVNLALRATVHVETFTLRSPSDFSAELFEVPQGYSLVPRGQAQKTPDRAKKRMFLANLSL